MAARVQLPAGPPLGFPRCPECPYLQGGSPLVCFSCASQTFEPIATRACPICSQFVDEAGDCPNWLCSDPARRIQRIEAIAYSSGALRNKILDYKYKNKGGWSVIFGRVLMGWLERNLIFSEPDLIVANPTWVEPGSMFPTGHTERVLEAAEREDAIGWWNFDVATPRVLIKTTATVKSAGNTALAKRKAAGELRSALAVTDRSRVAGKHILIYDDVCTTGLQLNAVAACLLDDGDAAEVKAVVMARAPWRRQPTVA